MRKVGTVAQDQSSEDQFLGQVIQVAIVTDDLYGAADKLLALGIGPWPIYELTPSNSRFYYEGEEGDISFNAALATCGSMAWEIIEPISGKSVYTDFLESGSKSLHHVAVDCNGIPYEDRVAGFQRRGYTEVWGGVTFDGEVPFAYFHSRVPDSPYIEVWDFPDGFELPQPVESYSGPPTSV